MRIKRLILRDFGLYRGEQVLDLTPNPRLAQRRPVVLIGGHNGAGKTTILEALRLSLYGRLALGPRVREVDYHAYLRGQIHRNPSAVVSPGGASVAVEFDYARNGQRSTFLVERSWQARGASGVQEELSVLCNGEPLQEVESEFWSDFVRTLVPPGLSQLFFFDGEKIQKLAEEDTEAETLAESVKALLGLDLVERLQADLDIYTSRSVRSGAGAAASRLSEVEARENELNQRRSNVVQDLAQTQTQLDYLAAQLARAEQRLAASGAGLASKREDLKVQAAKLATRISELERSLRELCEGTFVFAICAPLCKRVRSQLTAEERAAKWRDSQSDVLGGVELVAKRLSDTKFLKQLRIDRDGKELLQREIAALRAQVETRASGERVSVVHDLSDHERSRLREVLGKAQVSAAQRATELVTELEKLSKQLQNVQRRVNTAPSNEELQPIVRELSGLQERNAEQANIATQRTGERDAIDVELAAAARERKRLMESLEANEKSQAKLALATKARNALTDYLTELTVAKIARLEQEAVNCFTQLCRKEDLVRGMRIDPRSFQVTLVGEGGREVRKAELSAGEKQLYAVALLWALARVSGRPLPMIIDTPLGRLDSIHRQNLVNRYFPCASHQVVILSTDTEVDQWCFNMLRPHMSHSLCLKNHREGWTEAQSGYFWKGEDRAAATA
jgi:DNA sulfur modification protein DndD